MSYPFITTDERSTLEEFFRKRRSIPSDKREAFDKAFQKRSNAYLSYKAQFYWAAMIVYQDSPGATVIAVIATALLIATSIYKALSAYF